jgi:effector-binding domain-containing protein
MKILKKVILWLVVVIIALVIIGFLLPKSYKVERSAVIRSGGQTVYDLVCNLNKWDIWAPWTKELDSTVRFELVGNDCEVGTIRKWTGKKMGDGQILLTELIPGQLVAFDLSFMEGKMKSKETFTIEKMGDSCKVTWSDQGDLGYNPFARFMGLRMNKMMGPDFEKGLAKLKAVAEQRAKWPEIEMKSMTEQPALVIRDSAGPATYHQVFMKAFGEIGSFIKSNNLEYKGSPFAIYIKWDSVTMNSVMDIGIPVDRMIDKGKGRVRVEKLPAQTVAIAYYFGPYEKTADTYRILEQYIRESGKEISGGPWEIYVSDPMKEKDPSKLETDILFPVK